MSPFCHPRAAFLSLLAVLLFGLARVFMLPPFAGSDETAHYARIQQEAHAQGAQGGISAEVLAYTHAGPMPDAWIRAKAFHEGDPAFTPGADPEKIYFSYARFFETPGQPEAFAARFRGAPAAVYAPTDMPNWQYQHPPLYYAVAGALLRALAPLPLVHELLVLRAASFLAGFTGFALGVFALWRHGWTRAAALGAFYPLLAPNFFLDVARLGNDGLCLLFSGIVFALLLESLRNRRDGYAFALMGFFMGLGLWTKATLAPPFAGVLLFLFARAWRDRSGLRRPGLAAALALCLGMPVFFLYGPITTGAGILPDAWPEGGLPFRLVLRNILFLATSFVHHYGDWTYSGTLVPPLLTLLVALPAFVAVFSWLRQVRAAVSPEALPLWTAGPLFAALAAHAAASAVTFGPFAATPGHYLHVLAPVFVLLFGLGLLHLRVRGVMLGAGLAITLAAQWLNSAVHAGCARVVPAGEGMRARVFAWDTPPFCLPDLPLVFGRLSVLAFPGWGFALLAGGALAAAVGIAVVLRDITLNKELEAGNGLEAAGYRGFS